MRTDRQGTNWQIHIDRKDLRKLARGTIQYLRFMDFGIVLFAGIILLAASFQHVRVGNYVLTPLEGILFFLGCLAMFERPLKKARRFLRRHSEDRPSP